VIRYGIGVDNIDQQAARERRIMVANVPDYGTDEVQHPGGRAAAVVRRLRLHDREVAEGRWSTGCCSRCTACAAARWAFVGYGTHRAHDPTTSWPLGFGRVLAHDPRADLPAGVTGGPPSTTSAARPDVNSLHAPLMDETWHSSTPGASH